MVHGLTARASKLSVPALTLAPSFSRPVCAWTTAARSGPLPVVARVPEQAGNIKVTYNVKLLADRTLSAFEPE